jgi:biotin transport system substrate-specific component
MMWTQKFNTSHGMRALTLVDTLVPSWTTLPTTSNALTKAALVVLGSLLLAVSAQFEMPLYPVPVTGQTLVVLLIGMTYGPQLGGLTMAVYLFEGAIGLPVFAGGAAGFGVLAGPTGGYLLGFFAAAVAMGYLAERGLGKTVASTAFGMLIGNLAIYFFGVLWLTTFVGFEKALAFGVAPFLYGDALKLAVAAGLMPLAWRVTKATKK